MKRIALISILFGCGGDDDDDAADTGTTNGTGSASSGTTVVPPPPTTSASSSATADTGSETTEASMTATTDTSAESTGEPPPCSTNDDCDEGEACGPAGQCFPAGFLDYRVEITSWQPADCGTFFTPDLYVEVLRNDNETVETTTAVHTECPASWSSFCLPSLLGPGSNGNRAVFVLRNSDVGDDPIVDYVCWPSPTDPDAACEDVSWDVLHDGFYMGGTSQDGHVTISFTPGC